MSLTISNFKRHMIDKAISKGGLYENFGQNELRKLEERYDYFSKQYGSSKDREIAKKIDALREWAESFDDRKFREELKKIGTGMVKKFKSPAIRRLGY